MDIPKVYRWNSGKAETNVVKHGVAFDFAVRIFDDPLVTFTPTIRASDGEDRYKAVGLIDGTLYVAIFTLAGDATRLISARRTNAKEDRIYAGREF